MGGINKINLNVTASFQWVDYDPDRPNQSKASTHKDQGNKTVYITKKNS